MPTGARLSLTSRAHCIPGRCDLPTTRPRVPSAVVLELLRQDGRPIKPASLRNWTRRGYITHDRGYDLDEVLTHLGRRQETAR
jgi:hypothetical protein